METLVLAAIALAIVALSRTGARGKLAQRIDRLEAEVAWLRAALAGERPAEVPGAALGDAEAPTTGATADTDIAAARPTAPSGWPPAAPPAPEPGDARRARAPWIVRDDDPLPEPVGLEPRPAGPGFARRDAGAEDAPPFGGMGATPPTGGSGATPPTGGSPFARILPAQIDWEQWLGVRGAAVLGGAALALAGLFFFRYSIEHGLIPPWLRVVVGTLVGIGALAGAEWSLRKRYAGTANALAGGGLVILYAAFWAAGTLYGLIGPGAVFLLMVAVTVAGCALSWRHDSLVIAVIGLVGGFLTPFFASSGSDRPIPLFGYVLLLDAALIAIARKKRWPILALLSLAGTVLYQALWIGGRMGPERTLLGLGILALFAIFFAVAVPSPSSVGDRDDAADARYWRWSQAASVLLPFAFAIYMSAGGDLRVGILPLGGLLAILGLAAGWLARQHGTPQLALGAAGATVAVVVVRAFQEPDLDATPWATTLVFVVLAAAHHVAVEMTARGGDDATREAPFRALGNAATLVAAGLLLLLVGIAATNGVALWAPLAGWIGIAAVLARQGAFPGRGWNQVVGAVGVGLGLGLYRFANSGEMLLPGVTRGPVVIAAMATCAVAWQGVAIAQARSASRRWAEHSAAAIALVLLLSRLGDRMPDPLHGYGLALGLGFLVLLAATRLGGGPWMLVAVLATALVQFGITMDLHPEPSLAALALAGISAVLFSAWPVIAAGRLREDAWAWRASALAAPVWLLVLLPLWEDRFGDRAIGLLPLALGGVAVASAARARSFWPQDDPRRTAALAWLCGAALGLITAAVPLQLEKEWITIGWALEGAALVLLWTRLDHPGLKYTALALLGAVAVRLIANEAVLDYHARTGFRIVNWIAYAYLVPAAAMVWSARALQPLEVGRLRDWERRLYVREQPIGAAAAGFAALVVVFAWINLAIADWFSRDGSLRLVLADSPARNLTTSIAWAVYAVVLLALGIRLRVSALRWVSLGLLLITIAKIFLFDLGELGDLYRVASLLGLAISLIVVSLVYQRFVFRSETREEAS